MPVARWECPPYDFSAADRLSRELGLSPVAAAVLARRGHSTPEEARRFLAADERHDPFSLAGIDDACARLFHHAARGSRIVVHGDYDVDGVCSTAILVRALRALGADPGWQLPSRFDGGYGLSVETVRRCAAAGTELLVTTDCGITCAAEIAEATALGMEVVVTDHHRPGAEVPACTTVHPALGGYPFPDLCAAGVAHKLAEALFDRAGLDLARAREDLDLVALATVADLVPLRGENRRLVREGLRALARTAKPGLRALMRVARLDPGAVSAHTVGFRLAPRLNAAGRLGRPDAALELLLTGDEARAGEVADELDLLNAERRGAERRILLAAEAARSEHPDSRAYVLAGEDWHPGVIGIVASRLVERHHRPCVLIALDGDAGRGSGRSIPAYDLHAGLAECATLLRRFGGHRAAAGLDIDADRVEEFRAAFLAHAEAALTDEDLVPVERVDAVVPGGSLGIDLAEELALLEPFGQGNPAPALLVPAARLGDVRGMGEEREHTCFTIETGTARARTVAFGTPPATLAKLDGEHHDVAARLEVNEWNGTVEPRLVLCALRPTEAGRCLVLEGEEDFWPAVERELAAELDSPTEASTRPSLRVVEDGNPAAGRAVRDRRGQGFAGVVGDLASSGESTLVVCADASRRAAALERLLAGLPAALGRGEPGEPALALTTWAALAARPAVAAPYAHVVALDPPCEPAERAALERAAAGSGYAHLAWGAAEADFAVQVATAAFDLRAALAGVYRGLRESGGTAAGAPLEALLRGEDAHPRPGRVAGRLLRLLRDLGLAVVDLSGDSPSCALSRSGGRHDLEQLPAHRAYVGRLEAIRRYVATLWPPTPAVAPVVEAPAPGVAVPGEPSTTAVAAATETPPGEELQQALL